MPRASATRLTTTPTAVGEMSVCRSRFAIAHAAWAKAAEIAALSPRRGFSNVTGLCALSRFLSTGSLRSADESSKRRFAFAPGVADRIATRTPALPMRCTAPSVCRNGFGQMRFVQKDQAVDAEQARMDGLHAVRDAVAAKQQPRADLIDRGAEDRRLRGRAHPIVLQRRTASKPSGDERRRTVAGQPPKSAGDFRNHIVHFRIVAQRKAKRFGDLVGSLESVVHHEAPIHDKGNPQCRFPRRIGAQRQMEHGRVHRRGLSRAGWQIEHVRPLVVLGETIDQMLLPGERGASRVRLGRMSRNPRRGVPGSTPRPGRDQGR